ncbi:MAG TPA: DUF1499 domain-containing protein [Gemmatimonadota bacterium]|nr:DUF1499 domain-containing protein [Gemmatimonadota bacterium]
MRRLDLLLLRLKTNDVRTRDSPAYPDLQPLELALDPAAAWTVVLEAARAMPGWRILDTDAATRRIRAEATTPALRFTDDLWIEVEPAPRGSRVDVRSASRVGVTDFGTNARRIRAYLNRVAASAP